MKIFKPGSLSILTRCFEFKGQYWLGFTGIFMISLGDSKSVNLLSEKELWTFWSQCSEAETPLDEGIYRSRSEYLISGTAFNHGTDTGACVVEAQVGALRKRLIIHGDRYWNGTTPSKPQAFETMPLTWAQSFGGDGVLENPSGKGSAPEHRDSGKVHFLPNIENPDRLMASPHDKVSPAGFGPLDPMRPQRTRYQGTYDDTWLKTQFPGIASDTDWRFFNRSLEDQQQAEPFNGAEEYSFYAMHPSKPWLKGRLPGLHARAFVTRLASGQEKFKEIKTRLNTLWFFPDAERVILMFQGVHPIAEDDGSDILHLLAGLEFIDRPRPAEHYLHVRDKRLDKENGALESLREDDLVPAELVAPLIDFALGENRILERNQKRAEAERIKARTEVASHGLDPDLHAPPLETEAAPAIRNLDDLLRVRTDMDQRILRMKQKAEAIKTKSMSEAKAAVERDGKDFSLIESEVAGLKTRGPPKPFVDELLRDFRGYIAAGQAHKAAVAELEHMVADSKLHTQWREGESGRLRAYRMTAHYQIPVDRLHTEAAQAVRHRVLERQASGADFRGWDLTGADLSGLDLAGANLEGALMERANLTRTNLRGANLRNAVLAHADLLSTQCQHAVFASANLGGARIEKADFENADLTCAIFAKAYLGQVSWRGTKIDGIRLEEAKFDELDCGGAHSDQLITFHQLDLRGFNFALARLRAAAFIQCDVSGVDFSGAVFEKCAFVTLKAAKTRFVGMRIDSGCFAQQCDLCEADFSKAVLQNVSFRGAILTGAILEGAMLRGSDFSECELSQANLARVDASEARFVRARLAGACFDSANLADAVFQHARLENTDYRNANLFQSDFARVRVAPGVSFDNALCTRMRTLPRHQGQGESS